MALESADSVRTTVRDHYGKVAESNGAAGCAPGCCTPAANAASGALGYSAEDLSSVPEGADMGLGCGNPQAIAALRPGETVLDLGSGGGFDCFLAAKQVGAGGSVLGVDMTPQMVSKARDNARKLGASNVDFRLGEIEHLPVSDRSVDVIISNCVINLSPSKPEVFREAFRVLRPGGRLAISDVIATAPIPERFRTSAAALSGCVGGATPADELEHMLVEAGFAEVRIRARDESRSFIKEWMPGAGIEEYIVSATIEATKPGAGSAEPLVSATAEATKPGAGGRCCEPECCR